MSLNRGLSFLAALVVCVASVASADEPATRFIRYVDDPVSPRLETAIVSYQNAQGVRVDLIAAVHIGDLAYFDALNKAFPAYDALLYELVKPKGSARPGPGRKETRGAIGGLQRLMQENLDLEYQLDHIDYRPEHFVHADLDAETFFQKQDEAGESMLGLMLESMLRGMNNPQALPKFGIMDVVNALQAPDRSRQLKIILARQLEDVDTMIDMLEGPGGSVILQKRNEHAMKILREELEKGHKTLGVYYGAAHLPGMEQIMVDFMGFKRVGEPKWIVAWDLRPTDATTKPAQGEPTVGQVVDQILDLARELAPE